VSHFVQDSAAPGRGDAALSIEDLTVEFRTPEGTLRAVDGVSYEVGRGEVLGVVGESGSGKSVTAMSVLGLLPMPPARVRSGRIMFEGEDLLRVGRRRLREIRGGRIAMVFQDPMTALNPVFRVGDQLGEAIRKHNPDFSRSDARRRAIDLLEMVGIPFPAQRYRQYPHQYSGGMRQRVMIAMAIANKPSVLIADEPTTALDVTIQAQVLDVLKLAKEETGAATILISHDLGLIAEMADRVAVMYAGRLVESAAVRDLFAQPRHPYTQGLIKSVPSLSAEIQALTPIEGQPPDLMHPPSGCRFHPRCALRQGRSVCATDQPPFEQIATGRWSACHFHEEMTGVDGGVREREVDNAGSGGGGVT
jgi:oligopeptide/dipeptide ABC transporter ATP-binding protein